MNVILFGSLLNPLSAAAAQYLNEQKALKLIVTAKSRCGVRGGFIHLASQIFLGGWRYFHVFLRMIRVRRSARYLSLLEFIAAHPRIPRICFQNHSSDFERKLDYNLKNLALDECIAFSCVFPFKISLSLSQIKKFFNAHPGELPANRGPNPYFWALANNMEVSGITYHILTPQIDRGPILFREVFPINSNLSEYNLEKITAGYLKRSLPFLFERLHEFWSNAKPQGGGVYYPQPSYEDRKKYKKLPLFHIRDFFGR
jgi:folate-dependent phosphoribosylglycinamide formyltransferase PurN